MRLTVLFLRWAIPYFTCLAAGLFCAYHSGKRTPAKGRWFLRLGAGLVALAAIVAWIPVRSKILAVVTVVLGAIFWGVLLYAGDCSRRRKQEGGAT